MAAVCLMVGLGACGQRDYRYVTTSEYGNFFRLPTDWQYSDVTDLERQGRPAGDPGGIESVWHVQFSNSAEPGLGENELAEDLLGNAQVYTLSNYYRETNSISKLRGQLFHGIDPVYPPDDLSDRVELVDYQPRAEGRLSGSHVIANINVAEDGQPALWTTVDSILLVDDTFQSGRVYTLTMECSSSCYETHRPKVNEIATSWKVKQP